MVSHSNGRPRRQNGAATLSVVRRRFVGPQLALRSATGKRPERMKLRSVPWSWFDALPVACLAMDLQGRIRCKSTAAAALLEQPRDQLAHTIGDILVPQLRAAVRTQYRELLSSTFLPLKQSVGELESFGVTNDHQALRIHAVRWSDDSRVPGVLYIIEPHTGERAAEEDLRRFFDLSLDGFCIANLAGYFVKINANFSRRLGYTDAELTSLPFLSFVHPDDQAATISEMSRLMAGEVVTAFCNRYRDVGGNYRWFEWTARSLPGDDLVFAVARDVTDRMLVEQQLRAMERRERALLDNSPAVIYIKDREGRYQFVNREFSRLFHVSLDEARTQTDFDIFPDDLAAAFRANDRYVVETETSLRIEEVALHDDGPHTYLSLKFPIPSADGESIAVAGISTDITDRVRLKRTADELRLAQEVQHRLFPHGEIHVPGFQIFGKVVPASQLCGDYFDYVVRPSGRIAFCVADVSGHGIGPALEMVETRAILRMLLKQSQPLHEVVGALNQLLCEDTPETSFVTLFAVELDPVSRKFCYVGAGHDALLLHHHGAVEHLTSTAGLLGMFDKAEFPMSREIDLHTGDLLLICTDGVQETMSPERELFGHDRMIATINRLRHCRAATILTELFATARAFSRETIPKDDMTGILIKGL